MGSPFLCLKDVLEMALKLRATSSIDICKGKMGCGWSIWAAVTSVKL